MTWRSYYQAVVSIVAIQIKLLSCMYKIYCVCSSLCVFAISTTGTLFNLSFKEIVRWNERIQYIHMLKRISNSLWLIPVIWLDLKVCNDVKVTNWFDWIESMLIFFFNSINTVSITFTVSVCVCVHAENYTFSITINRKWGYCYSIAKHTL